MAHSYILNLSFKHIFLINVEGYTGKQADFS